MWISRIALDNWRAYERAVFDIPRPQTPRNNVVVIGAENGVGKTSLLEAVTLCLFGERGLDNLGRAQQYGNFMRGAFYESAALSSPKSSVSVTFETEGGEEIVVNRVWHFKANREFAEDDLFVQKDGKDIPIPVMAKRKDVLAGYITENFLPSSLSPFFLFDGARVQQMARSDMKEQVQTGIEGILGIPVVRDLVGDLHDYATKRRSAGMRGLASASKMEELQKSIVHSENELKQLTEQMRALDDQLNRAKQENNDLLRRFQDMGGDDVAGLQDLRKESAQLEQVGAELQRNLNISLIENFAMSLAGPHMLSKTALRLRAEISRVKWDRDKEQGAENYGKFIGNLEKQNALSLPLSEDALSALRKNLKDAWDNVWYPMPDDCAHKILNPGLSEDERLDAAGRLEELAHYGIGEIKTLREDIAQNQNALDAIKRRISEVRGDHSEEIQKLHKQMMSKRDEISALDKKKGNYEREKEGIESKLAGMRQEMGREMRQRKDNDPILHRAGQAENAARMIEDIIGKSYSHHVVNIAREMTVAFKAMAHKGNIISKIQIGDDCDIKILTPDGKNIRELEQSHGESEIFSLALIAAIARVSGNQFPFIVDTPLANLDQRHRQEFLRYFSSDMDNQIILLSTDEEIRDEHMDLIRHRVAHTFLIEQERRDGIGRNVVRPRQYFGGNKE